MFEMISRLKSRQVKTRQKVERLDARAKDTEDSNIQSNANIYKIKKKIKELEGKVDSQDVDAVD